MTALLALAAIYLTLTPVMVELLVHLATSPELPAKVASKWRNNRYERENGHCEVAL